MLNTSMETTADTTLREVNAFSIETLEGLIAAIDDLKSDAQAAVLEQDYPTAQIVAQALSILAGTSMQLDARRIVLENQRRVWDGEAPLPGTFTPTLPTNPA